MSIDTRQVDQLIDAGANIRALRRFFRSRHEVLQYYAAYQQSRFNPPSLGHKSCCRCGCDHSSKIVKYEWETTFTSGVRFGPAEAMLLFIGHLGIRVRHTTVTFNTFHKICQKCWRAIQFGKLMANVLEFLAVSGMVTGITIMAIVSLWYFNLKPSELMAFSVTSISAAVMIVAYPVLKSLARSLRIPRSIRSVPRQPFQYVSCVIVNDLVLSQIPTTATETTNPSDLSNST